MTIRTREPVVRLFAAFLLLLVGSPVLMAQSVNFADTAPVFGAVRAGEACTPPTYIVGASFSDPIEDRPGYMHVSVPQTEFTVANLVCVLRTIREARKSDAPLMIMFFAGTKPIEEIPDPTEGHRVNALVRAIYVLQLETPRERLVLTPFGYGAGVLSDTNGMRLDVDSKCDWSLDGRCLLACNVPSEQADGFTGAVALSGVVTKDGTIDKVRVLSQSSNNSVSATSMARVAVANLKSLWFEPSNHENRFRATYRFGVGAADVTEGDVSVDFSPEQALRLRLSK